MPSSASASAMSSNSAASSMPMVILSSVRDDAVELAALTAQFLRPLRVLPDGRVFEFPQDFGESLGLARIVKGTP